MNKSKMYIVAAGIMITVITFLLTAYMDSFLSRAEYLEDKNTSDITVGVLKNDMVYLKLGQREMKEQLKRIESKL